jgi:hypothetical protein
LRRRRDNCRGCLVTTCFDAEDDHPKPAISANAPRATVPVS